MKRIYLQFFVAFLIMILLTSCDNIETSKNSSVSNDRIKGTEGIIYELFDDTCARAIGYEGAETNIVIDNEYKGVPVEKIHIGAFKDSKIESVTIPDSVVSIYSGAFSDCRYLKEVILSNNLTYIDSQVFKGCSSLTTISFESIESYSLKIGYEAFKDCTSLQNMNLSTVTEIGENCFSGCSKLKTVILPNGISKIGKFTFYGCESLEQVDIPHGVTTIEHSAFGNCNSLKQVLMPNTVIAIEDSAFYFCYNLTDIIIPKSVLNIGYNAFGNCNRLKNITFENPIGWKAYWGDYQRVQIPSNGNLSNGSIAAEYLARDYYNCKWTCS